MPPHASFDVLIVENNFSGTLSGIVEENRRWAAGMEIAYLVETVIGLSSARNRALSHALDEGYDLLVFVDDDERVESDWLRNLLAEQQRHDLDIVGSPVRPSAGRDGLTLWQKMVLSGIQQLEKRSERRCRRKWQSGQAGTIKIATGSWMGRLEFFRATGLRFDSRFGLTGGEDWHLWMEAKKRGARTGWAPDAIVHETVPPCRLTLSYHFRRTQEHNATEFLAAYRNNPKRTLRKLPWKVAGRFGKLLLAVLLMPVRGPRGPVSAAMALGSLVGLVRGSAGRQFRRYAQTTGY